MSRVAVIGSGIIGLTSAIRLLEAGFKVTVLTKDLAKDTTSECGCGDVASWWGW